MSVTRPDEPLVVLGAGLSGLSFADALLDRRPAARLLVVDRRAEWGRDRTWCTWLTGPVRFAELSRHRWSRWRLVRGGREVVRQARSSPYIHLDSADVYAHVLERIERSPGARLQAPVTVTGARREGSLWRIETDHGSFTAGEVVDALGEASPLGRRPDRGLTQRFLGWEVETETAVFNPATATLMDFRGLAGDATLFFYVLPFSSTRALVEHTTIGVGGPSTGERRDALAAELARLSPQGGWRIEREERGVIPMTTASRALSHGPGFHVVGAAAGAIRASSGYAFTRTQRHVQRLVDALVTGSPAPASIAPARYAILDHLFLSAMRGAPDRGEQLLWDVARGVDGDRFARFMTDVGSPLDDARVAAAVPGVPLSLLTRGFSR